MIRRDHRDYRVYGLQSCPLLCSTAASPCQAAAKRLSARSACPCRLLLARNCFILLPRPQRRVRIRQGAQPRWPPMRVLLVESAGFA